MRDLLPAALLLVAFVAPSQQLDLKTLNPLKKLTETIQSPRSDSKQDALLNETSTRNGGDTKADESGSLDLSLVPFETRYYTDYYQNPENHKLYREVVSKITKKRLHCSYVGDREIIAGLVGDSNATVNDALKAVLPKSFITAMNVTTDEVDNLIDECNNTPPEEPTGTMQNVFKNFMKKLSQSAKDLGAYMVIFPGTKWCGAGDVARTYSDLGKESATDMCCRDHDHSNGSLSRGETREGLKNPLFYTMTQCEFDDKFLNCLRDAETAHAGAVGAMFFNLLKTKCFAKRKEATCVKKIPLSPCQNYTYDENSEERYQIFDPTQFMPKSNVAAKAINEFLYKVPGIDNILNLL